MRVSRPKLLLVDDLKGTRDTLRWYLEEFAGDTVEVVAEAADGVEAVDLARRLRPDVVLMDVRMPALDGIAATRAIHEDLGAASIVLLSAFDDDLLRRQAQEAGAFAFLLKDRDMERLTDTIEAAARAAADARARTDPTAN